MENGQYDQDWKYIHMMPEETAQAADDLRARSVLPGHAGRFVLAKHSWTIRTSGWRQLAKDVSGV